mmetsp:Transcript_120015/g.339591  ORF Transcript_120015/g.339591 Transcript_120015/m.339591 type:complete len:397 (+) Transcript_120015:2676-3866(+)
MQSPRHPLPRVDRAIARRWPFGASRDRQLQRYRLLADSGADRSATKELLAVVAARRKLLGAAIPGVVAVDGHRGGRVSASCQRPHGRHNLASGRGVVGSSALHAVRLQPTVAAARRKRKRRRWSLRSRDFPRGRGRGADETPAAWRHGSGALAGLAQHFPVGAAWHQQPALGWCVAGGTGRSAVLASRPGLCWPGHAALGLVDLPAQPGPHRPGHAALRLAVVPAQRGRGRATWRSRCCLDGAVAGPATGRFCTNCAHVRRTLRRPPKIPDPAEFTQPHDDPFGAVPSSGGGSAAAVPAPVHWPGRHAVAASGTDGPQQRCHFGPWRDVAPRLQRWWRSCHRCSSCRSRCCGQSGGYRGRAGAAARPNSSAARGFGGVQSHEYADFRDWPGRHRGE